MQPCRVGEACCSLQPRTWQSDGCGALSRLYRPPSTSWRHDRHSAATSINAAKAELSVGTDTRDVPVAVNRLFTGMAMATAGTMIAHQVAAKALRDAAYRVIDRPDLEGAGPPPATRPQTALRRAHPPTALADRRTRAARGGRFGHRLAPCRHPRVGGGEYLDQVLPAARN